MSHVTKKDAVRHRLLELTEKLFEKQDFHKHDSLRDIFLADSLKVVEYFISLEDEFGVNGEQLLVKLFEIKKVDDLVEHILKETGQ